MSTDKMIRERFTELEGRISDLYRDFEREYVHTERWARWMTSAQTVIGLAFDNDLPHFGAFARTAPLDPSMGYEVAAAIGIFRASKDDYERGFFLALKSRIEGEVFVDFVLLAKRALEEGSKDVAAVLACAALEDCLKRYAVNNGIDVSGLSMQDVVGRLKSKGLVGGARKALLDTMPKIRDWAMHANWDKFDASDVSGVIGFVESFLTEHFS